MMVKVYKEVHFYDRDTIKLCVKFISLIFKKTRTHGCESMMKIMKYQDILEKQFSVFQ